MVLEEELLAANDASIYRRIAARANYLSQDRADISYAVKELCREMSCPNKGSYARLNTSTHTYTCAHPFVPELLQPLREAVDGGDMHSPLEVARAKHTPHLVSKSTSPVQWDMFAINAMQHK